MVEFVATNGFEEFDKEFIFVREDRNGSRHYVDNKCERCGGTGYITYFAHVQGGVCFKCGGSGTGHRDIIVRTPEYNKKLIDRRAAKLKQAALKQNEQLLKHLGLNESGKCWIVLGDTFSIKQQLKDAGAKFNRYLLWHFDHEVSDFTTFEFDALLDTVNIDGQEVQFFVDDCNGAYHINIEDYAMQQFINNKSYAYIASKSEKQFVGNVGDKIQKELKLVKTAGYETQYGYTTVYTFEDEAGNVFVWKTGNCIEIENGKMIVLKGTIKDHSEYRGIKQNVLTRCKVV